MGFETDIHFKNENKIKISPNRSIWILIQYKRFYYGHYKSISHPETSIFNIYPKYGQIISIEKCENRTERC